MFSIIVKTKELLKKTKKYGAATRFKIFYWILEDKLGIKDFREHIKYKHCLRHGKVYFGPVLRAFQGSALRHYYMQELLRIDCSEKKGEDYKILEIGSWAGGSAITFAEAIKKYNNGKGIMICIDPWMSYMDIKKNIKNDHKIMEQALMTGKIFQLFQHNVNASGNENLIYSFRGTSNERLPMLKENQFDLIYIDGDHSYDAVSRDIQNSALLLKDGGIICGDDLEMQFPDTNKSTLEEAKNQDVVLDPKTGKEFHPGVTSAVWEFFKAEVSAWEGFWAMRKKGNRWENIALEIKEHEIFDIPVHLRNKRSEIMNELFQQP